jgi:zinc transport system substrate-binding protein
MIKIFTVIAFAITSTLALAGCTNTNDTQINVHETNQKLQVFATVNSVYDFVDKIGGEKIDLHRVMPLGVDVHHFEPTARDIVNLTYADIIFYNGAGLEEPWISNLKETIGEDSVIFVDLSQNIELIDNSNSHSHSEEHSHSHSHEEEHSHSHSHSHSHGIDPHVWLNPQNVKIQVKTIADALIKVDETNANYYINNLEETLIKLYELDKRFEEALTDVRNNKIIVPHKGFTYLAQRYGLYQIALEGTMEQSEPTPMVMVQMIRVIEENEVTAIFYSNFGSMRIMETIANEAGIIALPLNTFEGDMDYQLGGTNEYFAVMERNLQSLKKGLN